ncbi:hypothetical protein PQX77_018173, partial [Marasmius sp. AFHP31]
MAIALEQLLDGPVVHSGSQVGREDAYAHLWVHIFQLANKISDRPRPLKLLKEATDAPGNLFIEELVELYPDVQVVC